MPLTTAIRPVTHGAGYEVYRVADGHTLATVATYGEASRALDTVGPTDYPKLPAGATDDEILAFMGQLAETHPDTAAAIIADVERTLGRPPHPVLIPVADDDQESYDDDNPIITVIDDGARSGITVERHERPSGDETWLSFSIGERRPAWCALDVMLVGEKPGIDVIVAGRCLNENLDEVWTLDTLRRLHRDLGRLLADERVQGAFSEGRARCEADLQAA